MGGKNREKARKRLAKLRRMRIAAGHKADDHEQEQTSGTMSMSW